MILKVVPNTNSQSKSMLSAEASVIGRAEIGTLCQAPVMRNLSKNCWLVLHLLMLGLIHSLAGATNLKPQTMNPKNLEPLA